MSGVPLTGRENSEFFAYMFICMFWVLYNDFNIIQVCIVEVEIVICTHGNWNQFVTILEVNIPKTIIILDPFCEMTRSNPSWRLLAAAITGVDGYMVPSWTDSLLDIHQEEG